MKPLIALCFLLYAGQLHAQFDEMAPSLRTGIGYTHEFPGLNGFTAALEYQVPLSSLFSIGVGGRLVNLTGYPRTFTKQEFTKAETVDLNLYWSPFVSSSQVLSIGVGLSYSFYQVQRSYPVMTSDGQKPPEWFSQNSQGRTTGINIMGEYSYHPDNSRFFYGLRAALYKAYVRTYFIGPVIGFQF